MRKSTLIATMYLASIAAAAGCVSEEERRHEVEQLGTADLDLSKTSFGYWRNALAVLPIATGNCYDSPNVHVTNCQESHWGKTYRVVGRFMTLPGNEAGLIVNATASDVDTLVRLEINGVDYFKGTFCGDAVGRVRASGTACGEHIRISDGKLTVTNSAIRFK